MTDEGIKEAAGNGRKKSSIKPTVGRKVWVWAGEDQGFSILDAAQACDATVLFVHEDEKVNLLVRDHLGNPHIKLSIELVDPTDIDSHGPEGSEGLYASWMPYQMGQAAKAAEAKTPAPAPSASAHPTVSAASKK